MECGQRRRGAKNPKATSGKDSHDPKRSQPHRPHHENRQHHQLSRELSRLPMGGRQFSPQKLSGRDSCQVPLHRVHLPVQGFAVHHADNRPDCRPDRDQGKTE